MANFRIKNVSAASSGGERGVYVTNIGRLLAPGRSAVVGELTDDMRRLGGLGVLEITDLDAPVVTAATTVVATVMVTPAPVVVPVVAAAVATVLAQVVVPHVVIEAAAVVEAAAADDMATTEPDDGVVAELSETSPWPTIGKYKRPGPGRGRGGSI